MIDIRYSKVIGNDSQELLKGIVPPGKAPIPTKGNFSFVFLVGI